MAQLFTNNAITTLNGGITSATTAITVQTGAGALFPSPNNGDWFNVTIYQRAGAAEMNWEICRCTARAGDVLTVTRGAEGTTPNNYNDGDPIELRLTAAMDSNKMSLAQLHAAVMSF